MKQETLEEAAKEFDFATGRYAFKQGAKWEQKRSYSEEEVVKILYQFHYDLVNSNFDTKEEWFKQFKEK